MADLTVLGAAAITGGVALGAAGLQARVGRHAIDAERDRQRETDIAGRRRERQQAYETMLDVLSNFSWDAGTPGYDVIGQFNKPFQVAANRIRLYGSPRSIAGVDGIQRSFAQYRKAGGDEAKTAAANTAMVAAIDEMYKAARADVGPRNDDDGLEEVAYLEGAGPRL